MAGSWWTLLTVIQQSNDGSYTTPRFWSCPNDGEPYRQGPNGEWYCKFDHYLPAESGDPEFRLLAEGP